jgi:hypothetical protein
MNRRKPSAEGALAFRGKRAPDFLPAPSLNYSWSIDISCTKAGLDRYFPDRRKSIPGGCGKNVLFFTLRKIPVQSGLLGAFPSFMNSSG